MTPTPPRQTAFSQEFIGRWFGLAIFAGMTVRHALAMPPLDGPLVAVLRWALLTGLFALFTAAYLRRPKASALASRPVEILLPLLVVTLPTFQAGGPQVAYHLTKGSTELLALVRYLFQPLGEGIGNIASLSGMAIGEAFAIYSMLYLGRSFSIFAEARNLVTGGPYRIVRHPGYAGSLLGWIAAPVFFSSYWLVIPAVLALAAGVMRTTLEDRFLQEELPEYKEYASQVRYRLIPGIW